MIIANLLHGRSVPDIVCALQVGRSTVYDVAKRFRECGEVGLIDRREENGERKLDEAYLAKLHEVVAASAQDYGWRRPTWTRELLAETMAWETGVRIHVSTMSTALKMISARQGRPKPTVDCPWSKRAKNKRLRELRRLVETLPEDEVAVYEDEVDIHLNPKIGPDWMVQGQQKEVLTPGKNRKRYLAGAIDSRTGKLIWVEDEKKNTLLFIYLLWELVQHYRDAKVIHVILDNYSIHSTQQVEVSLATVEGQRIQLHFLPPYCPDHNRIERLWRDLHANVTRNHCCVTMPELISEVNYWLKQRNLNQTTTLSA
ncbi:MAG TPA: IS630 family transposase [Planctomycetes bacterium]|nr:IS630 family transposase [Planctomycetota bacterium]